MSTITTIACAQCALSADAWVTTKQPAPAGFQPVPICWAHAEEAVALNDQEGWPHEHHVVPIARP